MWRAISGVRATAYVNRREGRLVSEIDPLPAELTLLHFAEDRLLSPNDPDIKSLLRKGLIERAPNIKLMNETFQRFVLSQSLSGGLSLSQKNLVPPFRSIPLLLGRCAGLQNQICRPNGHLSFRLNAEC